MPLSLDEVWVFAVPMQQALRVARWALGRREVA